MYILDVCDNGDLLSVLAIVNTVITIIRVLVPIILLVSLMITYAKAVKSSDSDLLAKANKELVKKVVAALLILFIPSLVYSLLDLVDPNNKTYIACLNDATPRKIQQRYTQVAEKTLDTLRKTLLLSDYQIAKSAINKLDPGDKKNELTEELEEYYYYAKLKSEINTLIAYYDKDKYTELYEKIEQIKDPEIKEELLALIETAKGGKPLNIPSGPRYGSHNGMQYYEIVPPNPTTNMPLVIFLHGDWEGQDFYRIQSTPISKMVESGNAYQGSEFFYIAPKGNYQDWISSGIQGQAKSLIDAKIKEYSSDKRKIIIAGASRGAIGTWKMVNDNPGFFSAAMPMSCCPPGSSASNFKRTAVYAMSGNVGADEQGYSSCMSGFVSQINGAGGKATYQMFSGESHETISAKWYETSIWKWALSK